MKKPRKDEDLGKMFRNEQLKTEDPNETSDVGTLTRKTSRDAILLLFGILRTGVAQRLSKVLPKR